MSITGKRVKITVFVPCEAMNVDSITAADAAIDLLHKALANDSVGNMDPPYSIQGAGLILESFDVKPGRAKD